MESDPQTTLLDPLSTYEPKGIHNGGGLQTAPSTFPQHPRSFPPTHRETVVRKQQRRRRGRPCEDAAHPAWAWHEDEGFDYCEAGGAEEGEGTGENSYWGHAEEVDEEANRRGRVAGLLGGVKPWTASLYHGPGLFCLWRRRRGRWEGKPGALGVEEEEAKGAEVEEGKMNEAEEAGREDGQPQEGPRWAWPGMRGGGEKRVRFSRTSASSLPERPSASSLPERPSAASWQALQRMSTVSVDFLKKQDRRPVQMAWAFFVVYVLAGLWYFMFFKALDFHNALFQIINSLSAVGYGYFSPSTPIEQALTVVFLFVGVGFMGSLIGIVASSRLDFQEDVKKEWLARQEGKEGGGDGGGEALEEEEEEPGMSLMRIQMQRARQRVVWNIARIMLAILAGTVVLVPLEGWTWG
ncbi:Ion transport 2 [Nannochloropsis gaditana]|uniref:Ion transport 2 n=1 Tax=Nannochloropsis gaditana TaxID=72520 RepID=W7T821_9STRA|nr:Ion transport 2 [Nannochloropsis gaditana]